MTIFTPNMAQGATPKKKTKQLKLGRFFAPVLKTLGLLILAAIVAILGKLIVQNTSLEVSEISIDQVFFFQDKSELENVLAPFVGTSLLESDLVEIKDAVESLAWIQSASVSYIWPGILEIKAKEKIPVAIWNQESLVSQEAQVFSPDIRQFDLPALFGPEGKQEKVMEYYLQFNTALLAEGYSIESLKLSSSGAWTMILQNGLMIKLGAKDLESRFDRALSVMASAGENHLNRVQYLDARYNNAVALKTKTSLNGGNS